MSLDQGWHTPPPSEPPRDYADEPSTYRGVHPIKRGLAAAWGVIGAIAFAFALPFGIVVGTAGYVWWEIMDWLTAAEERE